MKIVAFAGSTSSTSINKRLVTYAASLFAPAEIQLLDLNDFEVPIYSSDKETEGGIPNKISEFAGLLDNANLIVLSLAEHNGSYSAAFKNTYDWLSRIQERKVFGKTPVFLMATSPGGRGGSGVLEAAQGRIPRDGSVLLDTFSLPAFYDNFGSGDEMESATFGVELRKKAGKIKSKHFGTFYPDTSGSCGIDISKDDAGDAVEY
jgi:chromate reductase